MPDLETPLTDAVDLLAKAHIPIKWAQCPTTALVIGVIIGRWL